VSERADAAGGGEIFEHDGERFSVAMLAGTETLDGGLIGGVNTEMESADAFDGEDFSGGKTVYTGFDGVFDGEDFAQGVSEGDLRAALPAGVGLGVEAAVGGVVVFSLAGGAHGERGHGGLGAVVGDAAGDGEARAAVGAVEERVAVAAVGEVEEFAEAVGASGGVGGNAGADAA